MKSPVDGVPMKHSLYIDQLTLEFWTRRRIDPSRLDIQGSDRERFLSHTMDTEDAFLVAFISDLNPHDEAIREIMWREHFLVKLSWLKERLPLLQMSEYSLYRRLRWLRLMGILESITRTVDGNKSLAYYRMSSLFWQIRARRHEEAAKAAKQVKAMLHKEAGNEKAILPAEHGSAKSHTPQGDEPYSTGTSKAIQDSHCSSLVSPPSPAGVSGAPPAEGSAQGELKDARAAFEEIRKACGMGPLREQMPREERIRARKKLLAEQALQLEAENQKGATISSGISPPLPTDGGASASTPPAPDFQSTERGGKRVSAGHADRKDRSSKHQRADADHQGQGRLEASPGDQSFGPGAAGTPAKGRKRAAAAGDPRGGGGENAPGATAVDPPADGRIRSAG